MAKRKTTKKELFEIIDRQKRYLDYLNENYIEPFEEEFVEKQRIKFFGLTGFYVPETVVCKLRYTELETLRKELKHYGKKRQTKK